MAAAVAAAVALGAEAVEMSENLFVRDNIFDALPALGVGIGFRERYRADMLLRRDEIDFLEITADHYLDATPDKLRELDLLAEHFTLIPHGLNLSLGSAEGVDEIRVCA
ncbi:MAG: hypothetical protein NVSMB56_09730 [Pyrinomonadaceae bacterium]